MRYLPSTEAGVLDWLRTNLSEAVSFSAVTRADDAGLELLMPQLTRLLDEGGRIALAMPQVPDVLRALAEAHTATLHLNVIDGFAASALSLHLRDGAPRALVGSFDLTSDGLGEGTFAVALDAYRDAAAAAAVSTDIFYVVHRRARPDRATLRPFEALMQPAMDELERMGTAHDAGRYRTGFRDLDRLTGGNQGGQLWVVTGPPGIGKTTLALGFARETSLRQHTPVSYFARQDAATDLAQRVLSAESRVPLHHMRSGDLADDDWTRLARRMGELAEADLAISERLDYLESEIADLPAPCLVVVDDVDPDDARRLAALRAFARNSGAWVVTLSPEVEDVLATFAPHVDLLLEICRDDYDDQDSPRCGEADLVVRTNRFGPRITITVAFQAHFARFVDMVTS